ncbi:MAG: hypothetical protein V4550_10570 [Gemmatimonadota bacterium]
MRRHLFAIAALSVSALTGCATLGNPVSNSRPIAAGSMERALKATVIAATSTDWVPKTISAEAGYVMAERGDPRVDPYRLEVMIPEGGAGSLNVKVTPLAGRRENVGSEDGASDLAKKFLEAFERAIAPR